jgi:hypothetical protein
MIATLKLDPARAAFISDFLLRYIHLNSVEAAEYNKELGATLQPEREEIMHIMHEFEEVAVHRKMVKTTIRQLHHRFGATSPTLPERLQPLNLDQLDELSMAVLDFKSLTEAEEWIARQPILPEIE